MNKAQQMGKWVYSGFLGISLAMAGLSSHIYSPWSTADQDLTVEANNETSKINEASKGSLVKSISFADSNSSLEKALLELSNALSWNELRSFPSVAYKDLVQQLAQEEFENGMPFILSHQRVLWTTVLSKGLKDYSRKVYRSPHFQGRSGYDLVHYELLLGDGHKAHLLAYREKTKDIRLTIGGEDLRPTRIDLYTQVKAHLASEDSGAAIDTPSSDNTTSETVASETVQLHDPLEETQELVVWQLQSFKTNGEILQTLSLNDTEFAASKEAIISLSVPLLTAGR